MRTTTFKCDRCGAEDTTNKIDIANVGVHVGGYMERYIYHPNGTRTELNREWCAKCRIETGLIEKPKTSVVEQKPLSLEDLIREIAAEVANDVFSQRS